MRAAFAAALVATASLASATPVAFVADLRGVATIEGDGKLTFLAEIPAGTRLLLGTNAAAAIAYVASGAEYALVGPGQFLVGQDAVAAERGASPKRRTVVILPAAGIVGRAAQTATASLRMRSIAPPPAQPLDFPVATRISTLKPTMRWKASTGVSYTLAIADDTGKEVWTGKATPGSKLGVTLRPATRYRWSVDTSSGSLGQAEFETLPTEALASVEKSRAARRDFPDRVRHALLLESLGASQEARAAWTLLARERPDLPELSALAR